MKFSANQTRLLDLSSQAIIKSSKTVNSTDFFLQVSQQSVPIDSVVVYTDYINIQLRAVCATINNFWFGQEYSYYFVLVRNRAFDSLSIFKSAVINMLQAGGFSIDNMVFVYNNVNCTN